MAIDKVKKTTIVAPLRTKEGLLKRLYELHVLHITDAFSKEHENVIKRIETQKGIPENNLNKLRTIKSTFGPFVKSKKGLFESFFTIPLLIKQSEFNDVLTTFDMDGLFQECKIFSEEHHSLKMSISDIESELRKLSLFLEIPYGINKLRHMEKVEATLALTSHSKFVELSNKSSVDEGPTWEVLTSNNKNVKLLVFFLKKEKVKVLKFLEKHDVNIIPLPGIMGTVKEKVDNLKRELALLTDKMKTLESRAYELYRNYKKVEIMYGYWESEKEKAHTEKQLVSSNRMLVISGYIRENDIEKLEGVININLPEVSTIYEDPDPKENIPVSISLNRFFKPAQLLINMFGLPNYFSFDPTPFLTIGFLLFFGICFGDAVYGVMLMSFSYYIMHKYKNYEDTRNFFKLFFYAGVSTTVIGILTGAWAGDLYSANYLGENNFLLRLRNSLMVIDPLAKPVIALMFAIGIGVINQFYGILLKMYGELRKGNIENAIYDCVLWLIFLPGILIIAVPLFTKIPDWLFNIGLYMCISSAIGLVLTQGRNEKSWAGKIITGLVSIYGILGTYGCTSFISDILSYSRLLALGLTTTIIAMSFNIIADIVRPISIIGTGAFILILIFGHTFNFVVCIISSFVHPARLIFLEFFSRFYQGGAIKFTPYGYSNKRTQIISYH